MRIIWFEEFYGIPTNSGLSCGLPSEFTSILLLILCPRNVLYSSCRESANEESFNQIPEIMEEIVRIVIRIQRDMYIK